MKRKLLFTLLLMFSMGLVFTTNLVAQMVLEYNTNLSSGTTVTLPLYGTVNVTVDWGDGNSEPYTTTGNKDHTYAADGVYTVSISGSLTQFGNGWNGYNNADKLIKVSSFGSIGLISLCGAFKNTINLEEVPVILPATITDLSFTFNSTGKANIIGLNGWDVSNVENMGYMFLSASVFNQDIDSWDVGNVTTMNSMFNGAAAYNQPLNSWDVSNVTTMNSMFSGAVAYNQPLNNWDVSNVTIMISMFFNAPSFNQDIGNWDVGNVTNMSLMFDYATSFNQDIGNWNVSSVVNMDSMFDQAYDFNQDIGNWDVSSVVTMCYMFFQASAFNQPLNSWDVSSVRDMRWMFRVASSFNQDIGAWDVSNVTRMADMFSGVTLSTANYNSLLIGWEALDLHDGVSFSGGNSKYSPGAAAAARAAIIADDNWTITDGGMESSIVWNGTSDNEWGVSSNWDGGDIPTIGDNVVIPVTPNNPVIIPASTGSCRNLTIDNGAALTLHSDGVNGTASLITNGIIDNNGTINVERYITSGKWHLISSPISDGTANTFLGDYLQYYDGVWNDITDPVTTLTPVQGYSLWDVSRATTFTFTGNLNNGDQSFGITSDNNGWNLLGNPYPSSIDWSLLDDSYGAVYYWDADNSNYISWNNGSGTGSQYVPAMQGFWINTTSNGTFTVTNAERTHNGISIYYKNKKLLADYLELKVTGNDFYDKLCVSLNSEATEHFDFHYDAFKLFSPVERVPQLYSYAGDNVLSIDVRPATEVIQLGFKCSENGNYTIGINDITNITFCVLEDTKTGLMSDLIKSDYNFNYSILDSDKRFKLHLQALGISKLSEDLFNVYANGNKIFIKSENFFNGKVTIINMMGQPVLEQKISNSKSIGIETNLSAGIYIVNVTNGLKSTSDKIIIE